MDKIVTLAVLGVLDGCPDSSYNNQSGESRNMAEEHEKMKYTYWAMLMVFCVSIMGTAFGVEEKPSAWEKFNERLELENAKYLEAHPDWPREEPAPHHIIKKAFEGMTGKELLEAVRVGVEITKEKYKGAPEAERDYQVELAIEKVLAFLPLIETNPKGHMNLFYVMSSANADPVYRLYLIRRSYSSDLPDTLFSLYLQDSCMEDRPEILGRFKNIILEKSENPDIQGAVVTAFYSMLHADVVDALEKDREVQRLADDKGIEITPKILKENKGVRLGEETSAKIAAALQTLDNLFVEFPKYFGLEPSRPAWLKDKMLDMMEQSLETFELPFAQKHQAFLMEQGRRPASPPSSDSINTGTQRQEEEE